MTAGPLYPKIQSVWKRDADGIILPGYYSTPEIEYLAQVPWQWTEKVDGTNIRLHWDGERVEIGGRTDNAQLSARLIESIRQQGLFDVDRWFGCFGGCPVTLYGEGHGAGIQKGGGNYSVKQRFIAFDCLIDGFWLSRDNLLDVCGFLGCPVVPGGIEATIPQMCLSIENKQVHSDWPLVTIEGAVGRPCVDLFDRKGTRLLVKIKTVDFDRWRSTGKGRDIGEWPDLPATLTP